MRVDQAVVWGYVACSWARDVSRNQLGRTQRRGAQPSTAAINSVNPTRLSTRLMI